MPLMGSLYVGTSGLQTSQNALNTVGHNLANVDTTAYTRQQVLQGNKNYNTIGTAYVSSQQVGLGVTYSRVRQVRDYFLDQRYRTESGRCAFYSNTYTAVSEMETLFGEMEGVEFRTALNDVQLAIQELAENPTNATNQGLLVSRASSFLTRAQAVYDGLASYQDNLNEQIKGNVDTINKYGNRISQLNDLIKQTESAGIETANDLRDERNQILDDLAGMVKMSYSEDAYGSVSVSIEGVSFVSDGYVNTMDTITDPETGFYTPVWKYDNNAEVFDLKKTISTENDTDLGGLKALMLARGDRRGNYLDLEIPEKPVSTDYATNAEYEAAVTAYQTKLDDYNDNVAPSLLTNVMAEFDRLIHGVVTGMNEILNPRTTTVGGTEVHGFDLFLRTGIDDVTEAEDPTNQNTLYSTSNLKINPDLLKQSTLLGATVKADGTILTGFTTEDKQADHTKSDALKALFADDFSALNPSLNTSMNFKEYYVALVNQVANTGSVCKGMVESQETTVKEVAAARQQVIGVSDSEELKNMIMFQNAYNANSRYINAVNEMLGTIIEKLG